MKSYFIFFGLLFCFGCDSVEYDEAMEKKLVDTTIDKWHLAAAEASFDTYFDLMTSDAVFIGTDATENWNRKEFEDFAKPRFDAHNAWKMKAFERHVYLDAAGKVAWFDELLKTRFKIARGSGVLVKIGEQWRIKHYVLSMTIPNDIAKEVVRLKTPAEDQLLKEL
ncbi:nuclear transport factor 2 family protein [Flavobacterium sp. T12S277]|uniref:nuclear transport factor 2 family protein n=1 Tax=Flavobacterium sp. T12S277 TaxID=3402752 RepID=UPI003AD87139